MNPILGPFELLGPHARGGMAEVWRGRHRDGTPVAIKVMTGYAARPQTWRAQFAREVRSAARLDHPAVVRLYDHGAVTAAAAEASQGRLAVGAPAMAMEWIGGGPIDDGPAAEQWPALEAALLHLLGGLAQAHARGVVHRDIKPQNVLLADRGPVLTDFGLAFDPEQADQTDAAQGTPGYMAPEQVLNQWQRFGPPTDLYALGCLAWHLLTGRPPYARKGISPLAVVFSQLNDPLPALEPRFPVPAAFGPWLERLLAAAPADRFQSAAEAATCLRSWTAPGGVVVVDGAIRPPLPADWRTERPPPSADLLGVGRAMLGHRVPPPVGREAARDALWAALKGVLADGQPRFRVVAGASGQGKTHLAEWLAEQAQVFGVARVLRATHDDPNGPSCGLPAMWRRVLRLGEAPGADRVREAVDDMLPGAPAIDRAELAALAAADGRGAVDAVRVWLKSSSDWDAACALAFGGLGARTPLVVVLDDLQWGPDARRTVAALRRGAVVPPMLVLATVRTDTGTDGAAALELFEADEIIELGPLDAADQRRLIEGLLPLDPGLTAQLVERSGGSPLFGAELLRHWVAADLLYEGPRGYRLTASAEEALPETVGVVWTTRLEAVLGDALPTAHLALELGAVLGLVIRAATWRQVCDYAGVPWPADAIARLLDDGLLLEPDAGRYRFAHAMLRETLQQWAHTGGRWLAWNACCARSLEQRQAHGRRIDPARLALHLVAAEEHAAAIAPLGEACRAALTTGDGTGAGRLLDLRARALRRLKVDRLDRRWLSLKIDVARYHQRYGRFALSRRHIERMLYAGELEPHPDLNCRAHYLLSNTVYYTEGPHRSFPLVARALPIAEAAEDMPELLWLLAEYGSTAILLGRLDEAERVLKRGLDLADPENAERRGQLYYYLANASAFAERNLEGIERCRIAREAFVKSGLRHNVSLTWAIEADLHRRAGRLAEAAEGYARHRADVRVVGPAEQTYVALNQALLHVALEQWAEAQTMLDAAADQNISTPRAAIAAARMTCAAGLGDWAGWDAAYAALLDVLPTAPVSPDVPWSADRAAALAEAVGDAKRAGIARRLAAEHRLRMGATTV